MSAEFKIMNKRKFEENKNLACREFNDEWKVKYMFTPGCNGKPVCLVCEFSVSVVKNIIWKDTSTVAMEIWTINIRLALNYEGNLLQRRRRE